MTSTDRQARHPCSKILSAAAPIESLALGNDAATQSIVQRETIARQSNRRLQNSLEEQLAVSFRNMFETGQLTGNAAASAVAVERPLTTSPFSSRNMCDRSLRRHFTRIDHRLETIRSTM